MHTEEFVLIPKAMFTEEKPQIAQVLGNRNLSDKNSVSLCDPTKYKTVPNLENTIRKKRRRTQ